MPRERLDSWKSIAEYLKRSARTVQRWHADNGLPVHHFGGSKGPVFAYPGELDAWLSGFVEITGGEQSGSEETPEARRRRSSELAAEAGELWELRAEENLGRIAGLYRKAIDEYPGNAPAFIGLANAIVLASLVGVMHSSAAYPRAHEAMRRALRLDFEPVEARCAAAWLQMVHERKWRQAREGFEEVLSKQPRSSHALSGRALLHIVEGNLAHASRCLEEAWKQNTFASVLNTFRCWAEYLAGDYEQALNLVAQARASGDNGGMSAAIEALAWIQAGPIAPNLKRLEASARNFPQNPVLQGVLGYAYGISDQTGRAWERIQNVKRMNGGIAYPLALILMGLDERHQAISSLEASYAEGSLWSIGFRFDPILRPLVENPRYESLLRKMGLPA